MVCALFKLYMHLFITWIFVGASVEIYSQDENCKGIFFQDQQMKQAFSAYPDLIFIDATYKLLQLGIPLYSYVKILMD